MKAMILAAGLGKRLRPLTNTIPKPNLMVGNKSLIQRNIELLIQNGFDEIVINVFHLKSLVKDHVISKFPNTKIIFDLVNFTTRSSCTIRYSDTSKEVAKLVLK